jgi:hypothetical protein
MARIVASLSQIDVSAFVSVRAMMKPKLQWLPSVLLGILLLPGTLLAESGSGPYARIAVLRPNDGDTVDFEAGYVRHLEWHRQAKDPWTWYGWSVWSGERQRWFVYATFGHTAASLNNPVSPAEDERDNISNVTPHAQFVGNSLYEFLPALSRGTGVPQATARMELTTVDLVPGSEQAFEAALSARQSTLKDETLWFRMLSGGSMPRYVRLRPRPSLAAILESSAEQALPDKAAALIAKTTIEILNLRPNMSYGVTVPAQ